MGVRFYPTSEATRRVFTVLWVAIGLFALYLSLHRHRTFALFCVPMLLNALLQTSLAWRNFWEIEDGSIVQHSLFYRKRIPFTSLKYAGPVRREKLSKWLKKTIELDAQGISSPLYVNAQHRTVLLQELQKQAPQAEIICF